MAKTKRKKKKYLVRFELGIGGLFSLGVVCFCIFLWMFLLGIWAGQTVLQPSSGKAGLPAFADLSGILVKKSAPGSSPGPAAEEVPLATKPREQPGRSNEASFFSLQVAAFRDAERAGRAVENWKAKGYDAFAQPAAESSDGFARVFVGKFEKLSDANALAAKLEKREGVKAYIALLPAAKVLLP